VKVVRIDPLRDRRWRSFLAGSGKASVFHTPEWLEALRRTYGYEPAAVATLGENGELSGAVVYCLVKSWLTGRRLVSLPFSDFCEPLLRTGEEMQVLAAALKEEARKSGADYVEIRAALPRETGALETQEYCRQKLALEAGLDAIFDGFHASCVRRKIRRAEREGVKCEEGNSRDLLEEFYRLLGLTRGRHGLPPQPRRWFENLLVCMGDALRLRIAFLGREAIAGILTLRYKNTMTYKYGCSDERLHALGGVHLLLWKSIQEAARGGCQMFDFGRSDLDNGGLIAFKDRWGAQREPLRYFRLFASQTASRVGAAPGYGWKERTAKKVLQILPAPLLRAAGTVMYRHIG